MARPLTETVASGLCITIQGNFERHVSTNWSALAGSTAGGRWGHPGMCSVLYLGRPRRSVTVEAYRHLVDPFATDGMTADMVAPRRLLVCEVDVTEILDLRAKQAQHAVDLTEEELSSPVGDYQACQRVAREAHRLGLHGILAPAASGLGETLALFEEHLPPNELPRLIDEELWDGLPVDPRHLRLLHQDEETA